MTANQGSGAATGASGTPASTGSPAATGTVVTFSRSGGIAGFNDTLVVGEDGSLTMADKDGKVKPARAKSSRVYVKQGGQWMLVHANFGADPLPSQ